MTAGERDGMDETNAQVERQSSLADNPDIDLYCLECGYNLRGLTGDPRRCPECGHLNPLGDLEVPAELISEQLGLMESIPARCSLWSLLVGVLGTYALGGVLDLFPNRPNDESLTTAGLLGTFAGGLWLWWAYRFRRTCQGRPGWVRALLRYHLWAIVLVGAMFGLIPGIMYIISVLQPLLDRLDPGLHEHLKPFVGGAVVVVCVFIFVAVVRRVHKRLTAELEPLQREVAVRIARGKLRKVLAHEPGGFRSRRRRTLSEKPRSFRLFRNTRWF